VRRAIVPPIGRASGGAGGRGNGYAISMKLLAAAAQPRRQATLTMIIARLGKPAGHVHRHVRLCCSGGPRALT